MDCQKLKEQIAGAPAASRVLLEKVYLYTTAGDQVLPEFAEFLESSDSYQDFVDVIYGDLNRKSSMLWGICAQFKRRNWLQYFEPKMLVQNIRLKGEGIPVQFGSGMVFAPTGSRDNIANLYVFASGGFNAHAAEFVTSIGGTFTMLDREFCGIYGLYKYRGSVIMEEWQVERDPVEVEPDSAL
ncbi:MAG TPA: hypothetical protein DCP91_00990 [Eggerthellaceae bacterium]|nr:hypothetical protein [Eggerthellaceae bacterium]